jgi:hypothetical protein
VARSFKGDAQNFAALANDLKGSGLERTNRQVGERAKKLAAQAASADLGGDPKFSGWAPTLDTQYRSLRKPAQGVVISPTKTSAGPWTVAQDGRNRGAGGFAGPGINRRTGRTSAGVRAGTSAVRANRRGGRTKRWSGYTDGKNTASDAVSLFERDLLDLVEKGVFALTEKRLGR